jgi:hypothetical protein
LKGAAAGLPQWKPSFAFSFALLRWVTFHLLSVITRVQRISCPECKGTRQWP